MALIIAALAVILICLSIVTLVDKLKKGVENQNEQLEERLAKITECFLSFGTDPVENINRLTVVFGELLGASCTLYNRLEPGMLYLLGQWQTPVGYNPVDKAEGHICYETIQEGSDEITILHELPKTKYALSDPLVRDYNLNTYIGKVVKSRQIPIDSLCALYQTKYILRESDRKIIDIIAAAIGVEEERRATQESMRKSEKQYALAACTTLEIDLRWALERQELLLHYQPIVLLKSGKIAGFEALVRWQHPTRGLVSPAEFIPVAEETGLIIPLGWWVLQQACHQMRIWQEQFPTKPSLVMSVNISGKQFAQPHLVKKIEHILQETGLDAGSLKLEITESTLVDNAEAAADVLKQLKALGIQVAIDDFGTGYSSLSYLHRMPIDTLKIDRSFVHNVEYDPEKIEIIRTIVGLAWNLGMDVVAEGVETKKQMYQLQGMKSEYGQGYFFSKPLDSQMAGALIASAPKWIEDLKPVAS